MSQSRRTEQCNQRCSGSHRAFPISAVVLSRIEFSCTFQVSFAALLLTLSSVKRMPAPLRPLRSVCGACAIVDRKAHVFQSGAEDDGEGNCPGNACDACVGSAFSASLSGIPRD